MTIERGHGQGRGRGRGRGTLTPFIRIARGPDNSGPGFAAGRGRPGTSGGEGFGIEVEEREVKTGARDESSESSACSADDSSVDGESSDGWTSRSMGNKKDAEEGEGAIS